MMYDFRRGLEHDSRDSQSSNWRLVASAWAVGLFFLMLFAAVEATACRASAPHHSASRVARAVIPQHDPCVELGVPSAANINGCESVPRTVER